MPDPFGTGTAIRDMRAKILTGTIDGDTVHSNDDDLEIAVYFFVFQEYKDDGSSDRSVKGYIQILR